MSNVRDVFYTINDVAKLIGKSAYTIRKIYQVGYVYKLGKWDSFREIPRFRFCGAWLWKKSDVLNWLERQGEK